MLWTYATHLCWSIPDSYGIWDSPSIFHNNDSRSSGFNVVYLYAFYIFTRGGKHDYIYCEYLKFSTRICNRIKSFAVHQIVSSTKHTQPTMQGLKVSVFSWNYIIHIPTPTLCPCSLWSNDNEFSIDHFVFFV